MLNLNKFPIAFVGALSVFVGLGIFMLLNLKFGIPVYYLGWLVAAGLMSNKPLLSSLSVIVSLLGSFVVHTRSDKDEIDFIGSVLYVLGWIGVFLSNRDKPFLPFSILAIVASQTFNRFAFAYGPSLKGGENVPNVGKLAFFLAWVSLAFTMNMK